MDEVMVLVVVVDSFVDVDFLELKMSSISVDEIFGFFMALDSLLGATEDEVVEEVVEVVKAILTFFRFDGMTRVNQTKKKKVENQ